MLSRGWLDSSSLNHDDRFASKRRLFRRLSSPRRAGGTSAPASAVQRRVIRPVTRQGVDCLSRWRHHDPGMKYGTCSPTGCGWELERPAHLDQSLGAIRNGGAWMHPRTAR